MTKKEFDTKKCNCKDICLCRSTGPTKPATYSVMSITAKNKGDKNSFGVFVNEINRATKSSLDDANRAQLTDENENVINRSNLIKSDEELNSFLNKENDNRKNKILNRTPSFGLFDQQSVVQSHSHRRHYSHHLLDHFSSSSSEQLQSCEAQPKRGMWKEIIPVTTQCSYKDTNFLSQGSPPRQFIARPVLKPRVVVSSPESSRSSITEAPTNHKPGVHLPASLWKEPIAKWKQQTLESTCRKFEIEEQDNEYNGKTLKSPTSRRNVFCKRYQNENVDKKSKQKLKLSKSCDGQLSNIKKSKRQRSLSNSDPICNIKIVKSPDNSYKLHASYELKSRSESCSQSSSIEGQHFDIEIDSTSTNNSRFKCPHCSNRFQRESIYTQTSVNEEYKHAASQTIIQELENDDVIISFPYLDDSDETSTATPSSLNDSTTEKSVALSSNDSQLINDNSSIQPTRQKLIFALDMNNRITEIHEKIQQMKNNCDWNSESFVDELIQAVSTLDQVTLEGIELYDDFDYNEKDKEVEIQNLKRDLLYAKRSLKILKYELSKSDSKISNLNEESLNTEIKLCRHVAVSLHWELQTIDEQNKKLLEHNIKLRHKITEEEIQNSINKEEVKMLRNTVDQLSLHSSSVTTVNPKLSPEKETLSELQRQVQFSDEECKAMLGRLVNVEMEKERLQDELNMFKNEFGEISLRKRWSGKEEWRNNDLKIRIKLAEDQAGLMSRKIVELHLEKENLVNQMADKSSESDDSLKRMSDFNFLEDELEALRFAFKEIEEENNELKEEILRLEQQSEHHISLLKINATTQANAKEPNWSFASSSAPSSPRNCFLTSPILNSNFNISTALEPCLCVDAETQTYCKLETRSTSAESLNSNYEKYDVNQLIAALAENETWKMDSVVAELHKLALATRDLLGEHVGSENKSISIKPDSVVEDCNPVSVSITKGKPLKSSLNLITPTTPSTVCTPEICQPNLKSESTNENREESLDGVSPQTSLTATKREVADFDTKKPEEHNSVFRLLLCLLMLALILSSMDIMSVVKFTFMLVIFFLS